MAWQSIGHGINGRVLKKLSECLRTIRSAAVAYVRRITREFRVPRFPTTPFTEFYQCLRRKYPDLPEVSEARLEHIEKERGACIRLHGLEASHYHLCLALGWAVSLSAGIYIAISSAGVIASVVSRGLPHARWLRPFSLPFVLAITTVFSTSAYFWLFPLCAALMPGLKVWAAYTVWRTKPGRRLALGAAPFAAIGAVSLLAANRTAVSSVPTAELFVCFAITLVSVAFLALLNVVALLARILRRQLWARVNCRGTGIGTLAYDAARVLSYALAIGSSGLHELEKKNRVVLWLEALSARLESTTWMPSRRPGETASRARRRIEEASAGLRASAEALHLPSTESYSRLCRLVGQLLEALATGSLERLPRHEPRQGRPEKRSRILGAARRTLAIGAIAVYLAAPLAGYSVLASVSTSTWMEKAGLPFSVLYLVWISVGVSVILGRATDGKSVAETVRDLLRHGGSPL